MPTKVPVNEQLDQGGTITFSAICYFHYNNTEHSVNFHYLLCNSNIKTVKKYLFYFVNKTMADIITEDLVDSIKHRLNDEDFDVNQMYTANIKTKVYICEQQTALLHIS